MAFKTGKSYETAGGTHEAVIDMIRPATIDLDGKTVPMLFPLVGRVRLLGVDEWRLCCWTHDGRWGTSGNPYHLDLVRA